MEIKESFLNKIDLISAASTFQRGFILRNLINEHSKAALVSKWLEFIFTTVDTDHGSITVPGIYRWPVDYTHKGPERESTGDRYEGPLLRRVFPCHEPGMIYIYNPYKLPQFP